MAHAVVIGASIAGLLTASVLNETHDKVTVYDRDTLPAGPGPRRGVPQGRQLHALHARGAQALTELLPGFWDDMVAAGGATGDTQADVHWYLDDYLLKPDLSGLTGIALTRPTIEHLIRSRVAALDRVTIADGMDVTGLAVSEGRVTGVRVQAARTAGAAAETVAADLVIDAAGRASRTPAWLAAHGFPVPSASQVRAGVVYVSRLYSRDPAQLDGRMGSLVTPYPGQPRGAAVLRQDGDRFIVVLAGMVGEVPPTDETGMLGYADSLACPDIAAVMRGSVPLTEPLRYRFGESTWWHYEALDRRPSRYLVIGDAICSLNPVYGQGMTIAALEALTLRRLLGEHGGDLERRYFRATGKLVAAAWQTSAVGDLRFPAATGQRPPGFVLLNAYLARYRAAASVDPLLGRSFLRVANMIDKPTRLLAPGHVLRVIRAAPAARRAAGTAGVSGR